jgi:hypothetical protein
MRKLLTNTLFWLIGSAVVAYITGLVVAKALGRGDEASDEFRRVVVFSGDQFRSSAESLRTGELTVILGGALLDLREASLDPAGADLDVQNTLGGLQVLVRDDWLVEVEKELIGGGEIEVDVAAPDDLPADAPHLRIRVLIRYGGTQIAVQGS